uniref:Uncharacterized protein n=1 Tax=Arundo donax TaxID=35708 RepID=A0A0A9HDA7_ARUDO
MINCNTITIAGGCFLTVPLSSPRTVKRRRETAIWNSCWTRTPLTTVHLDTMFLGLLPLGVKPVVIKSPAREARRRPRMSSSLRRPTPQSANLYFSSFHRRP